MKKLETLGDRLQSALDEAGIKQAELARRTGIDGATVHRCVNDLRVTSAENYQRMANALDIELTWLISGEGERKRRQTPGRVALDTVLATMEWPAPQSVEAADVASRLAREEAEKTGRDRAASVWRLRLLELYAEALAMPAGLEEPSGVSSVPPPPASEPPSQAPNGPAPAQPARRRR